MTQNMKQAGQESQRPKDETLAGLGKKKLRKVF